MKNDNGHKKTMAKKEHSQRHGQKLNQPKLWHSQRKGMAKLVKWQKACKVSMVIIKRPGEKKRDGQKVKAWPINIAAKNGSGQKRKQPKPKVKAWPNIKQTKN